MEAYLDNAATTQLMEAAFKELSKMTQVKYGNPSSLHNKGIEAEKEIVEAKNQLAKQLRVDKKEIYYTSGGTESNNIAIIGIARANKRAGMHIVSTCFEHPSVELTLKYLEEEGYEISRIPVNPEGILDLEELQQAVRQDTILVTTMHVNNEIGAIQDLEKIGEMIKKINPHTKYHVDAVQSFGKIPIYPRKWLIDALSISGHKIYAPKGIGVLYVKEKTKITPLMYGGNQQLGIRPGTENTPSIVALTASVNYLFENMNENQTRIQMLKERLVKGVMANISGVSVNGARLENSAQFEQNAQIENSAPHILNMRFDQVKAEVLLHALESKNIYISTGSACSSNKPEISKTLKAIGLTDQQIGNSIRFSFSIYNTEEEIDYTVNQLIEIIPMLRRFVKK